MWLNISGLIETNLFSFCALRGEKADFHQFLTRRRTTPLWWRALQVEVKIKSILQQCSNFCTICKFEQKKQKLKMGNSFDSNCFSQIFLESLESSECWTNWFSSQIEFRFTHQSFDSASCLSLSLNYLELNNIFHLNLHEYFYFAQDDLEKKKITPQGPLDESLTCCHLLSLLARHLRMNHSEDFMIFFAIKKS